jgi:hypothetical protein
MMKRDADMTDIYQGFANYATWLIALTYDNDEFLYKETQRRFRNGVTEDEAEAVVRLWTPTGVDGMENLDEVDFADLAKHWSEE